MISQRQADILNGLTLEYINSAKPVSSQTLEKKYSFGASPATIRIEMQDLTEAGFLFQPHTSAGRVPTDKGYRFFVDNILSQRKTEPLSLAYACDPLFEIEESLKEDKEDIFKFASRLTKFLSQTSSNFAVFHLAERDFFLKEGWEQILKEPEFKEQTVIFEFTDFLKNLEEDIEALNSDSGINVYIGKENPFPKSGDFSIISCKIPLPFVEKKEEDVLVSILGPKRMDYDKNIGLINSLTKLLENL